VLIAKGLANGRVAICNSKTDRGKRGGDVPTNATDAL